MSETVRVTWRRKIAIWWHWKRTNHRFYSNGYGDAICYDCGWGLPSGWYFVRPGCIQNFPLTPWQLGTESVVPSAGETPQ